MKGLLSNSSFSLQELDKNKLRSPSYKPQAIYFNPEHINYPIHISISHKDRNGLDVKHSVKIYAELFEPLIQGFSLIQTR